MDGGSRGGGGGQRQMYEITCSNCGNKDMVPFQPRGDRPVLCGDCFRKQKEGSLPMDGGKNNKDQGVSEEGQTDAPAEESNADNSAEATSSEE